MNTLSKVALENIQFIKDKTGNSSDITVKDIKLDKDSIIYIVYCQSVAESDKINDFVLEGIFLSIKDNKKFSQYNMLETLENIIPNASLDTIDNCEDIFTYLFNGFCLIIMNNETKIIAIETKANIDRGIQEASIEPIMYGPKDSFTEHFHKNIGLIRKRIKTESLWIEEKIVGRRTKTKVGILYIHDVAEQKIINNIKEKIDNIDIDGIIEAGQLKQLIYKTEKSSFPIAVRTERPDLASLSLLEGRIIIIVENSPIVLIIPSFLSDFMHSIDDFYQKPKHVFLTRLIKILAFFVTIITPGYFVALLEYNSEIIPTTLMVSIIAQRSAIPFPAFIEAFMLAIIFEIIKESDIRLPINIGGSISILGALVLGQAAISAGVISAFMLIVIAISAISSLVFQSLELTNALRYWRLVFLVFGSFLGVYGILLAGFLIVIELCTVKSFGKPFLSPIIPFDFKELKESLIKSPLPKLTQRNKMVTENNSIKQRTVS